MRWHMQRLIFRPRQEGTERQTHSLFQESSASIWQTQSDLKDFEVLTMIRNLAKKDLEQALISP